MIAYMVRNDKKIEPFGDYVRDCLIGNKKLRSLQSDILSNLGLDLFWISDLKEIDNPNPHLIIDDNLYFTKELIKEFIKRSMAMNRNTRCILKRGLVTLRSIVKTQEVEHCKDYYKYPLYFSLGGGGTEEYQDLKIDPDQGSLSIPLPKQVLGEDQYLVPITTHFLIQINHWTNLWAANIAVLLAKGARLQKSKTKLFMAAFKARSLNKYKMMAKLNKIGCGCDIHPTAWIEASTIGNNVRIDAGAVVSNSVIDDDSFIDKNVVIDSSIIGTKCRVSQSQVSYSVLYPNTEVASYLLASITGRGVLTGVNSTPTDFRFDGKNILVKKENELVDTGNKILGSCFGHHVFLGSGCVVAPGRMIPNNWHIALNKERIIRSFPDNGNLPGFRLVKR